MLNIPSSLKNARIVVSNDDGVTADGIAVLERVARKFSDDVWVVAPDRQHSGAGHSLSLHSPIHYKQLEEKRFSTSGTPTDSVLLAALEIIPKDKPISLVLSGINQGMNIAEDVTYSGTIAAAMEGTLLDIPSIAFSQSYKGDNAIQWDTAEHYAAEVIESMLGLSIPKQTLISVNFPNTLKENVAGISLATQGRRKIIDNLSRREDPKGNPYVWVGGVGFHDEQGHEGSDLELLKANHVTVTPLQLDLTNYGFMSALAAHMEKRSENALEHAG